MSIDCSKSDQGTYWARMHAIRFAGSVLLQVERSNVRSHRGKSEIERFPSDNLLIYFAPDAPTWFRPHQGEEFVAEPGSIVVGYADVPFSQAPRDGSDYKCVLASLPISFIGGSPRGRGKPLPKVISPDRGAGSLLRTYFEAWVRELSTLEPEAFEVTAQSLALLAAIAHGSAGSRQEQSREALAEARVEAAERFIARNIQRRELSPSLVADSIGLSVRRLHLLFEPTGKTFSQRVLALRLAKARALLVDQPSLPITEVAFRSGFESLSTFYRAFKSAFQMTATDFRAEAAGREEE
jgi:AraC-like DNA-binding protein